MTTGKKFNSPLFFAVVGTTVIISGFVGLQSNKTNRESKDIHAISADSSLNSREYLEYSGLFTEIYGPDALSNPGTAFNNMTDAIAAFEKTPGVSPFSSKYDRWLQGKAELSDQELRGLKLFEEEDKGNCAACHPSRVGEDGSQPLFTDFTYAC